jgi:hypothetical protein
LSRAARSPPAAAAATSFVVGNRPPARRRSGPPDLWADNASRRKRAKGDQGSGSSARAVQAWVTNYSTPTTRIRYPSSSLLVAAVKTAHADSGG